MVDFAAMTQPGDFVSYLPAVLYYYTGDGSDLWCRRPYTFFFSSEERASRFLAQLGSAHPLTLLGVEREVVLRPEFLAGLRRLQVSRIFIDPEIDATSGDVVDQNVDLEITGLIPLRWAVASLLTGIGSTAHDRPDIEVIRDESAALVEHRGGHWQRG